MEDQTKMLLFVALSLLILVLVSNGKRPTASTPIDGADPVDDATQTPYDQSMVAPTWAANVPTHMTPPLSLLIPTTGVAPTGGNCD